jgi:thioredoxin-related protein
MINRRKFNRLLVAASALVAVMLLSGSGIAAEKARTLSVMGDDGMYHQSWFLESFLDLREDLAEATQQGKRLVIMWEQKGCPYCRETHLVNLADPDTNKYIRENFVILQLNLWGSREVIDFDGKAMEERALARRWGVIFTPTIMFMDDDAKTAAGKSGDKVEVVRMPGYFKPFHFVSMFEYVKAKAYKSQHFQKFLQAKADKMRAEGKEVKLW